jgi:hypothetical protein
MATKNTSQKGKKKPEDEQDPKEPEGTEDTDTDEDTDEDPEDLDRKINAIVTSRLKRELKPFGAQLSTIAKQLESMSQTPKKEETDEDEEEPTKKPVEDPKAAKRLMRLEKELAEEKAARTKAEKERVEEAERSKRNEMRNSFASILTELGITSPRLQRAALDQLEQDGIMIRDEDGKVKFKGQDKYGIEQTFDPKVGLKTWIANDGKEFAPAVDAGGSGTGGTVRNIGANAGTGLRARSLTSSRLSKRASINLERACTGLPPLGEEYELNFLSRNIVISSLWLWIPLTKSRFQKKRDFSFVWHVRKIYLYTPFT